MFIVELEENVWLAPWQGDPGRTCKIENSRKYASHRGACIALGMARKFRKFEGAVVVPLNGPTTNKG